MNPIDPNEPAFPTFGDIHTTGPNGDVRPQSAWGMEGRPGLTKREYFAAMAMQGFCANSFPEYASMDSSKTAQWAVTQADALISELNKPK